MDVSRLNEKIRKLQKEIKKIQNSCHHKKQEIKFVQGYNIRWVCKECDLPLAWPSKKEKENWLK
jgi:predicted transcriptional regulator